MLEDKVVFKKGFVIDTERLLDIRLTDPQLDIMNCSDELRFFHHGRRGGATFLVQAEALGRALLNEGSTSVICSSYGYPVTPIITEGIMSFLIKKADGKFGASFRSDNKTVRITFKNQSCIILTKASFPAIDVFTNKLKPDYIYLDGYEPVKFMIDWAKSFIPTSTLFTWTPSGRMTENLAECLQLGTCFRAPSLQEQDRAKKNQFRELAATEIYRRMYQGYLT